MRHSRILILSVVLAFAAALSGCSQRAARLVGNERLLRGPGGIGTTMRAYGPLDRDTYVAADTAEHGTTLIAGLSGSYEARTLLRVDALNLPDTTDASVAVDSVFLEIQFDGYIDVPADLNLQLWSTDGAFDPTTVQWPGPAQKSLLGTAKPGDPGQTYAYRIGMGNGSNFSFFENWAANVPSMVLLAANAGGIVGFKAGTGRIRIAYQHDVAGVATPDTVDTPIAENLFVHSTPDTPPTGSDPTLLLGGLYETALALHFPVDSLAPGFAVNEARLILRLDTGSMTGIPPGDSTHLPLNIEVRRIRADWPEGAVYGSDLEIDSVAIGGVPNFSVSNASDSLLIVPVPTTLLRDWSASPADNHGILIRIEQSFRWPAIHVYSRESAHPPELWISTTSPPPGRF